MAKILDMVNTGIPVDGSGDIITASIRGDNLHLDLELHSTGNNTTMIIELERKEIIKLYQRLHREHEQILAAFHDIES